MEKVVLKVNYETEDEKKGEKNEVELTNEGSSSPKPETAEDTGAVHICSPSIESCPSPETLTLTVSDEKLTASEEKETEDAESGSSMSTLSLPSSSNSEEDSSGSSSGQRIEEGVTNKAFDAEEGEGW